MASELLLYYSRSESTIYLYVCLLLRMILRYSEKKMVAERERKSD